MKSPITQAELDADTRDYFVAVRNIRAPNSYARAHAREVLKRLALDSKSLALAEACCDALRKYGEPVVQAPISYFHEVK